MSTEPIRLIMQQYDVDFGTAVKIYQGMSPADAKAEVETRPPTISQTVSKAFWEWAQTKYSPEEIEIINDKPDKYLQFYQRNIQGTQWDVGMVADADWQVLMNLRVEPDKDSPEIRAQLEQWIKEGRIDQAQASDIWGELPLRHSRARAAGQRGVDFMRFATGQAEFPEDRAKRLEERARAEEAEWLPGAQRFERAWQRAQRPVTPGPFTEFGTAEEFRTGFDLPQTEPAIAWFNRRFPRLIQQFQVKPKKEQTAATWAEFLERRKSTVREEFSKLSPFQRGERPSAFAPRIQTTGF